MTFRERVELGERNGFRPDDQRVFHRGDEDVKIVLRSPARDGRAE